MELDVCVGNRETALGTVREAVEPRSIKIRAQEAGARVRRGAINERAKQSTRVAREVSHGRARKRDNRTEPSAFISVAFSDESVRT